MLPEPEQPNDVSLYELIHTNPDGLKIYREKNRTAVSTIIFIAPFSVLEFDYESHRPTELQWRRSKFFSAEYSKAIGLKNAS